MNKINVFCFGFGQTAKSFVKKLKIEKIPFKLTATSRQETQNKNFEDINYESFQFNEKIFDNFEIKIDTDEKPQSLNDDDLIFDLTL